MTKTEFSEYINCIMTACVDYKMGKISDQTFVIMLGACMNHFEKAKFSNSPSREVLFAEVDKSNERFQNYSKEERQNFAAIAKALAAQPKVSLWGKVKNWFLG